MRWICVLAAFCCLSGAVMAQENRFEYRDFGWNINTRGGTTVTSNGFEVKGSGEGVKGAVEMARTGTIKEDDKYNLAVANNGAAGHGVAYPLYVSPYAGSAYIPVAPPLAPVYVPVPAPYPVPVYVPDPYPVYVPYALPARRVWYSNGYYWP